MELLEKAKSSNDFGLRKRFPWSDSEQQSPWTRIVTDPLEINFVKSQASRYGNCVIKRVENPYLWGRYILRYEELNANEDYDGTVEEHIVIHATTSAYASNIADSNFDWRRVRRGRFGQGVSFSGNATYANKYASSKGTYIIAGILVGKVTSGGYHTIIPSENYDTTKDDRGYVFVKYYDDDFYPYYIVQ